MSASHSRHGLARLRRDRADRAAGSGRHFAECTRSKVTSYQRLELVEVDWLAEHRDIGRKAAVGGHFGLGSAVTTTMRMASQRRRRTAQGRGSS
jgi:hypothetical protein